MYYIKYMPYKSIKNASRNIREIETACEFGFDAVVFSSDNSSDGSLEHDYSVQNDGTESVFQMRSKVKKLMTIISNRLTVYKITKKLPFGIWSCHDLHSLKIAYFATLFRSEKPILIYDSHEFELGRNTKRGFFKKHLVKIEEKFLINRCAVAIMVNDSIADEVRRIYHLEKRPIVVRSTPNYWPIDESVCMQIREQLIEEFNMLNKA